MSPQLCRACSLIPAWFWGPEMDREIFPQRRGIRLQPFRSLQAAANAGCPLCTILIASAETGFLNNEVLENVPVTLSRAMLDSHQAVCLKIGIDDMSHTTFFRVPEPWNQDSLMSLGDQVNNIKIMQTWIEECRYGHDKCSSIVGTFFPSRILDLQAFGSSQDIRLVPGELTNRRRNGSPPEYLALSHCWGLPGKHPMTTTMDNLEDRMLRICIANLSKTFRDAVRIARALGVRYLWVDSLCIIQDDEEDWAKEAARMADVYGNATCTLAALSSKDSTEGCSSPENIQKTICPFLELKFEGPGSCFHRLRFFREEPRQWHKEYGDNPYRHENFGNQPLRKRAWTLQERELSRRSVHFAKDQLLWECRELKASAQLPWHHKEPEDDFKSFPIRNYPFESLESDGPVAQRDLWYTLMEDSSSRSLTYERDKLPALSGLARYFQSLMPTANYAAGIWTMHLPAALLWQTRYRDAQRYGRSSYIAPSWSWASISGEISYESQRVASQKTVSESTVKCDFENLTVKEVYTKTKHNDEYGAITDGYLTLSGAHLVAVDCEFPGRKFEDTFSERNFEFGIVLTKKDLVVGAFYPDIPLELLLPSRRLVCMKIRTEHYNSTNLPPNELYKVQPFDDAQANEMIMGLILEKHPTGENKYSRVGLARWVRRSLFEDSSSSIITLV